jgi:SAM-dependent methyltransferase
MDSLAKEYLVSFYSKNLLLHGDRPEALRWSPVGQRIRYRILLEIVPDLNGKKVLDYGCGKGDLYGYAKEHGIDIDYTGLDINPELVKLAKEKHPDAAFGVADAEEAPLGERFDIVFICGVFNNRVQGVEESMLNVLSGLFEITGEALAINALSTHSGYKAVELNYTSPEELSLFVEENLTPHYMLRQDYLPGDFTMFLYKEAPAGVGR